MYIGFLANDGQLHGFHWWNEFEYNLLYKYGVFWNHEDNQYYRVEMFKGKDWIKWPENQKQKKKKSLESIEIKWTKKN